MDPLSIAASAVALSLSAAKIGKFLYQYYDDTKSVDSSLEIFSKEVQTLSETLNSVGATLKDPKLQQAFSSKFIEERGKQTQLSSLNTVLLDCGKTLTKVDGILEGVQKGKTNRGPFRMPTTAIKLNLKSPDLVIARNQLGSYLSAMQLNLHMMNLLMSADTGSAIGRIDEALETGFESLKEEILALTFSLHSLGKDSEFAELPEFKEHVAKTTHVKEYLQSTEEVIANASEYYGSVSGSLRIDQSVRGLSAEQANRVNHWVPSANQILGHEPVDVEDEDDFEKSMIRKYLRLANSKMNDKKYADAEIYFNNFISKAKAAEGWIDADIAEANIGLATAFFAQGKFDLSRKVLEPYGGITDSATSGRVHRYLDLAEIFFACGWLKLATQYGEAAMKGLHKYKGPASHEFLTSVDTLRVILLSQGEVKESEFYETMLPKDFRPHHMPGWTVAKRRQLKAAEILPEVTVSFLKRRKLKRGSSGLPASFAISELLNAVKEHNHAYVKFLLEQKYVDAETKLSGGHAIAGAIENSDIAMAKLLIEHGACVDTTSWGPSKHFNRAVEIGHWPMVDLLLASRVNLSTRIHHSLLRIACGAGHLEIARLLIQAGADVNGQDSDGGWLIGDSITAGDEHLVRLLLDNGARFSKSMLEDARRRGNLAIIKLLESKVAKHIE